MDMNMNQIIFGALPAVGLVGALAGTYQSYTPTTDQNLLIGSLTLLVVHLYANSELGGFGMSRLLKADVFTLPGLGEVGSVNMVSTVVLVLALAMQVAYIERTRALPAVWRKRKD